MLDMHAVTFYLVVHGGNLGYQPWALRVKSRYVSGGETSCLVRSKACGTNKNIGREPSMWRVCYMAGNSIIQPGALSHS